MINKFVKIPKPGQFRGQGEWVRIDDADMTEKEWEETKNTQFLPTYEGDSPPSE